MLIPFKNTYCSVYIHVDKVVQKTRHWANLQPSHFGPLQSTLCSTCLQVFLCGLGLIFAFGLDIKTELTHSAKERGPSKVRSCCPLTQSQTNLSSFKKLTEECMTVNNAVRSYPGSSCPSDLIWSDTSRPTCVCGAAPLPHLSCSTDFALRYTSFS